MSDSQRLKEAQALAAKVSSLKKLPWFYSEIGPSLTPAGRELLEVYSHIESSKVEEHIYKIREQAWEIFPFPCVGRFKFVSLDLSLHPIYPKLLSRLRSSSPPTRFLDVGTCLGQDLRKLVYDGVALENLYGTDLFPEFENVGYELFRDSETFQGHFIAADLLDAAPDNALTKTEGTWDVVNIFKLLHLFDWETQVLACRRLLQLLNRKPGNMIIGAQLGSAKPGELAIKPPFVAEGQKKTVYMHDRESFTDMWTQVMKDQGVELSIQVHPDEREEKVSSDDNRAEEIARFLNEQEKQTKFCFTVEII